MKFYSSKLIKHKKQNSLLVKKVLLKRIVMIRVTV